MLELQLNKKVLNKGKVRTECRELERKKQKKYGEGCEAKRQKVLTPPYPIEAHYWCFVQIMV